MNHWGIKIIGLLSALVMVVAGGSIFVDLLESATGFDRVFEGAATLTAPCAISKIEKIENLDLIGYANVSSSQPEMLKFPLRLNGGLRYYMGPEKVLLVVCHVNLQDFGLKIGKTHWLTLGPVNGHLLVLIDNRKLLEINDEIAFPVVPLPNEAKVFELKLIMTANNSGLLPMVSLYPMVVADSWKTIDKIQMNYNFSRQILPFGALTLFFALAIVFVVSFNLGIRYFDVMWTMIGLSFGLIDLVLNWKFGISAWWNLQIQLGVYTCFAIALVNHIDRNVKIIRQLAMFAIPTTCSICLVFINPALRGYLVSVLKLTSWLQVILYLYVASTGLRPIEGLAERRQYMRMIGTIVAGLVALGMFATNVLIELKGIWLRDLNLIVAVTVISGFITVDLVLFHRGFFRERALRNDEQLRREHEEREKIRLAEVLLIGQTAQELLLPMTVDQHLGGWSISYRCKPHINMAGDWMDSWTGSNGSTIVLIGDVSGKGPSAAIAMAAIMTLIQEARVHGMGLTDAITMMSPRLHGLFKGAIVSTWAGIEIQKNGSAFFCGGGSPGWFVLKADGPASVISCRLPMLGISPEVIQVHGDQLTIEQGDKVVSVSDGICGSSRQLKQFFKRLDSFGNQKPDSLIASLFEIGDENKIGDDQSLVVISEQSAA
jgi:serine phosphatase RsbU (regulator of sigma subunit)